MKTYKDLELEVWNKHRCSGCGACTSVCPADNLYFKEESPVKFECDSCSFCIATYEEERHYPISAEFCKTTVYDVPCGACYDACPRVGNYYVSDEIGNYLKAYAAKSTLNIKYAQNGGVVSSILYNAFEEDLIDGAIVMNIDRFTLSPYSYLAKNKEDVLKTAGSKYLWREPPLRALKRAVMEEKLERLAIVGTPCVMDAVAKILASDNDLLAPFRKAIKFKIGLFCFEIYDYNKLVEILKKDNIEPWEIKKMEISKGKLNIYLIDGTSKKYKLVDIEKAMREGCKFCNDFTAQKADISIGNVGSGENYSTVLIRNKWGEGLFKRAVYNGYVHIDEKINFDEIRKISRLKMKRVE
ncbi:Coenzyme F420 hydrogenase/dehydrogenase, beta subunit C-terminal domain [Methanocaldococcus indicus]|uniref:Coenzyme F420 hydrogenase/dehydrogenase, beta subunit C-terminal domain n=1 Tax=Methanocaldococcus indicus TaxID=213231 RepID=UPI003C6D0683